LFSRELSNSVSAGSITLTMLLKRNLISFKTTILIQIMFINTSPLVTKLKWLQSQEHWLNVSYALYLINTNFSIVHPWWPYSGSPHKSHNYFKARSLNSLIRFPLSHYAKVEFLCSVYFSTDFLYSGLIISWVCYCLCKLT
jgi:hypothetical protein